MTRLRRRLARILVRWSTAIDPDPRIEGLTYKLRMCATDAAAKAIFDVITDPHVGSVEYMRPDGTTATLSRAQ